MPLNTEVKSTLEFLDTLLSRKNAPKKQITDLDLKDADLAAIQERAKTYTGYLKNYVEDYKQKTHSQKIMKAWFFVIVMILLIGIIVLSFVSLIIISNKETIKTNDVITVITAMAGAISSFLVLPRVMAENLFPSKEEDKTADVFSKMFEHDINLRGLYHVTENIDREKKMPDNFFEETREE